MSFKRDVPLLVAKEPLYQTPIMISRLLFFNAAVLFLMKMAFSTLLLHSFMPMFCLPWFEGWFIFKPNRCKCNGNVFYAQQCVFERAEREPEWNLYRIFPKYTHLDTRLTRIKRHCATHCIRHTRIVYAMDYIRKAYPKEKSRAKFIREGNEVRVCCESRS